jgi:nitrate/nitrite transport system ATP-binding protein
MPPKLEPILKLEGVAKSYGEGTRRSDVLKGIDFEVADGEFVAVLGYSGTGKTTLISLMAGLTMPDDGRVLFRGAAVRGPGPERGVVFQSYSLMPWLSVRGNITLAVDAVHRAASRPERKALVTRYVELVGLTHAADRLPRELSGGMRQRVAVARALAMQPQLLLLDEPLSALDALTRAKLQDELALISATEKKAIVLVTNDVDEAILLADRVIPLLPGKVARMGPAFAIDLEHPRDRAALNSSDRFVALRREITACLMAARSDRQAPSQPTISLPNVVPISRRRRDKLPAAYAKAAQSPVRDGYVEFSCVTKTFATPRGPLTVVDGFDLKLRKGEFVSIIGHSGCGKSTVLSMVAGLTGVSGGGIIVDNSEVVGAGPERAVVFQAPSLMPWLTARENVALGVDRVYPRATAAEKRDVIEYYLQRVGLADAMHKLAADLSNGMKQRVGIARAFALSPKLLLLDEPFGMLDSLTRWELQDVLMDVWARTNVTTICVTHDVDEAILLADRVVMMSNGPRARIGNIMHVDLPRPRTRKAMLDHSAYYAYREELLDFLEAYEGGANPPPELLERIRLRRETRTPRLATAAE